MTTSTSWALQEMADGGTKMFGFVHVRRCGPDDFVLHERRPGEETFVVGHRNLQEAAAWIVRAQHNAV